MVSNACLTLSIRDLIEIKFEITSSNTGDCWEGTWLPDSFSVMVIISFQNMIWAFPKRLMFDKILVSSNKLTSPILVLYNVPVLNLLIHADSNPCNLTLYKVCVYAVKMTSLAILFQTKMTVKHILIKY